MKRGGSFWGGLTSGLLFSLLGGTALLLVLSHAGLVRLEMNGLPELSLLLGWLERNFGLSLIPFAATLLLYLLSLNQLAKKLAQQRPQDEIDQLEHLIDVWTSLFFGIGVIWTAIGMRGALLYALGDIGQTDGGQAAVVLQRLVDGGILTALSTTIAGGVGGYLMRLYKTLVLGVRLNRYYRQQEMLPGSRIEQLLTDISQSVAAKSVTSLPLSEPSENGVSK